MLKGLESALRESLPGLILVLEFSPNSLKVAGSSGEELLQLLLQLDLRLYIFDHRHQRLLFAQPQDIISWVRLTQMDSSSQGFINLVCATNQKYRVLFRSHFVRDCNHQSSEFVCDIR